VCEWGKLRRGEVRGYQGLSRRDTRVAREVGSGTKVEVGRRVRGVRGKVHRRNAGNKVGWGGDGQRGERAGRREIRK